MSKEIHPQERQRAPGAEDRARLLIENIPDQAIFTLDTAGRIESWNQGAARLLGYREEEILGQPVSYLSPPDEPQAGAGERLVRAATTADRAEEEGWWVRKDGSRFWGHSVLNALRDDSGSLQGVLIAIRDVTARRQNEEQLRESAERFKLLVDRVEDYAIFMLDPEGRIATWNAGAQRIKGYKQEEVVGRFIEIFYTPEDRQAGRPRRLLGEAAKHGRVEDEGWRVRKDGSRFWADVVITALRSDDGKMIGFAKVTRDLTERRQAQERLRESEERFRLLVSCVQDYAIFMLDKEGRVATWNLGAERLKGYTAQEIVGQHFSRFYPPEAVAQRRPELELREAIRVGRFEDEGWRVRKDGTRFWANVVLTAIRDERGALLGFTKVTRDLTDRRKAEEERLRLVQAQEAIRLRDEFLSIASHELKTPLTALRLQLQNLSERMSILDERVARKLERATRSSERLAELVETLLDVSRLTMGQFRLRREEVSLSDLAAEVVESLRGAAERAGCTLVFQPAPEVTGSWDRLRIEQVISNLVTNAIKYAAGTRIEVTVSREGNRARLTVADRGPGIPEAALSRIFDRFERAASSHHYGGLGLGLYVAREIARAHDGTVMAENRSGGGALFTVELPLDAATPAAEAETEGLH